MERLAGPSEIDRIAGEWCRLEASLTPRLPFATPLWNKLWWRHLRARSWLVRDEFLVHAVRDASGRLIAVAPLMMTHRPAGGLLRVRELRFFGADPNITEIRGLICRAEHQPFVARALAELGGAFGYDWFHWDGLSSAALDELRGATRMVDEGQGSAFVLDLPSSWAAFRETLPRNIKEALRKGHNSLQRSGHRYRLRVIDGSGGLDDALTRFFAMHAARANAAVAVRHRDVFADPAARRFITEYARHMAALNQLRLFELEIDGVSRAARLGFLFDDELYLYYSGYEPEWGRFSVMTTALAEIIKWAIDRNLRLVNLSTGSDVSKTRWRPREVVYRDAIQLASTWRGRAAFHGFDAMRHAVRQTDLIGQVRRLARARAPG
ncbi:MAG: GNAT family N-acetyltransferase [Alphaproteobacteria bacterium]|nr:GNAT family N-acetyltransferase [Alphaproteobacteria bacterium]